MIPPELDYEHLIGAIEEVKNDGFTEEDGAESRTYDLYYDNKRYPPKVIIRRACKIAGLELGYMSGGEAHSNKYFQKKGFIILEKRKTVEDYFFNSYEMQLFSEMAGKHYDKNNLKHQVIRRLVRDSLQPKTNYWAKKSCPDNFTCHFKNSALKQGHAKFTLRGYTWASIFKKEDEDKGIYFTVGIDVSNTTGKPSMIIKLDCEGREEGVLTAIQQNNFKQLVEGNSPADWYPISCENLTYYNWDLLITETSKFIIEYEWLYEKAIEEIWGEKRIFSGKIKAEEKLCRICWNTNGWIKPSGRIGKAKNPTYEKDYGFGHEEWLFDRSKIINGYHYAFLEPIRKHQTTYEDRRFNLLLYTINGSTGEKYWVGNLKEVEVLSKEQSAKAHQEYKSRGWLDEIEEDLEAVGVESGFLAKVNNKNIDLFNIRFRVKQLEGIFEAPIPIENGEDVISTSRYSLLNIPEGFKIKAPLIKTGYDFNSGDDGTKELASKTKKRFVQKEVELDLNHNKIVKGFLRFLQKDSKTESKRECKAFGQNKIDIVQRTNEGDIFYEVKTYNNLVTSLRVAFGQLFEYCLYPAEKNAIKLYLVSDKKPDSEFVTYLEHVNKFISIPLGYICFDIEKEEVITCIQAPDSRIKL